MIIEWTNTEKATQRIFFAGGIHGVCTNVPIWELVTTFLKNQLVLDKHMCIALNGGPPERILEPERGDGLDPIAEVNIVHDKKEEGLHMRIERYMKAKHEDAERKVHN